MLPRGGGTKPALSGPPGDVVPLELGAVRGIVGYDPAELTLTALAGTPLAELASTLEAAGQYLPFDPPLAPAGATIGGTVASGLSGPGSHRHGGIRDFVIGVRFLDGTGELVTGGGQVVKNAAGFDLPKLLVGSLGRLGVIVEVSLKVLPAPPAWGTLRVQADGLEGALAAKARLGLAGVDIEALDFEPSGKVSVRLGGPAEGLERRLDRVALELGLDGERLLGPEERRPLGSRPGARVGARFLDGGEGRDHGRLGCWSWTARWRVPARFAGTAPAARSAGSPGPRTRPMSGSIGSWWTRTPAAC